MYILSFSLRVYLVLVESKIEKQFSLQIDLHCGNLTFISFQMFMSPRRNVPVGFTYITRETYKLHRTFRRYGTLSLAEKEMPI